MEDIWHRLGSHNSTPPVKGHLVKKGGARCPPSIIVGREGDLKTFVPKLESRTQEKKR